MPSTSPAAAVTKRTRRRHKNSRLGCANCKRRQIKCDESLPTCTNCGRRDDVCSYVFLSYTEFQQLALAKSVNEGHDEANGLADSDLAEKDNRGSASAERIGISNHSQATANPDGDADGDEHSVGVTLNQTYTNGVIAGRLSQGMTSVNVGMPNGDEGEYFDFQKYMHELADKNEYVLKKPGFYSDADTKGASLRQSKDLGDGPLPGAHCVNKTFNINRDLPLDISSVIDKTFDLVSNFESNTMQLFFKKYGVFDIDEFIVVGYRMYLPFIGFFNKLIRKSLMLFAFDVVKNTLCTQKRIMKDLPDDLRVKICAVCDTCSIKELSELTSVINNDYINMFSTFSQAKREVLFCAFITIASCTAYHYNSGYRKMITASQSKQCTKFIGTFTAGMTSVMISEFQRARDDRAIIIQAMVKYIYLQEKSIILPHKDPYFIKELYDSFKLLKIDLVKDYRNKPWASAYINLTTFLEKHIQFLTVFKTDTLLGFDNGYLIRMINELFQMHPYDLVNLTKSPKSNSNDLPTEDLEIDIIIKLTYVVLRYCVQACAPGIRSLVRSSFAGADGFKYDKMPQLILLLKSLKKKEFKYYAIYVIRLLAFLRARSTRFAKLLNRLNISPLKGRDRLSTKQRCQALLQNWKNGNVLKCTNLDSFKVKGGSYFTADDFPTYNLQRDKTSDCPDSPLKVTPTTKGEPIKFKSAAEMIKDFELTNTGFFSNDYNPSNGTPLTEMYNVAKEHGVALEDTENNATPEILKTCWDIENFIKFGE